MLALSFGIFAPFAVYSTASAMTGLVAGVFGLLVLVGGTAYWILNS
ncbi:MAG: hypothetical protein ABI334_06655 [Candidatus Dormiibacterota bacterium]